MIVFAINYNFFIVLPFRLKACRSYWFLFFTRENVRAQKIGHVSDVFRAQARSIGIGSAIRQGLSTDFID